MSCKCPTCLSGITDGSTHDINEPVQTFWFNDYSISEYISSLPIFTNDLWTSFVLLF